MRILRVFPRMTSYSPIDPLVRFGFQSLALPKFDEIHISITFTWDIEFGEILRTHWERHGKALLGGVAFRSDCDTFMPGLYVRKGIVFTSRGCPNRCSFCLVPDNEGKLKELPITEGNIIQDNNFLACSDKHIFNVFRMLKKQRAIEFKGGLEASRITVNIAYEFSQLRIKSLWLACDTKNRLNELKKAVELLTLAGFKRDKLYCYVLIGDDLKENEERLRYVWDIGCMPFAQLYQPPSGYVNYSKDFKDLSRKFSRPAISRSIMTKGS